jgi:hypothetical protein
VFSCANTRSNWQCGKANIKSREKRRKTGETLSFFINRKELGNRDRRGGGGDARKTGRSRQSQSRVNNNKSLSFNTFLCLSLRRLSHCVTPNQKKYGVDVLDKQESLNVDCAT